MTGSFRTYKCCICDPPVLVTLDDRAKHDAVHHRKAKRKKSKQRINP